MSKWDDAFPLTSLDDARALRREQDFRDRELADLPDPIDDEDAAYEEWLAWMES